MSLLPGRLLRSRAGRPGRVGQPPAPPQPRQSRGHRPCAALPGFPCLPAAPARPVPLPLGTRGLPFLSARLFALSRSVCPCGSPRRTHALVFPGGHAEGGDCGEVALCSAWRAAAPAPCPGLGCVGPACRGFSSLGCRFKWDCWLLTLRSVTEFVFLIFCAFPKFTSFSTIFKFFFNLLRIFSINSVHMNGNGLVFTQYSYLYLFVPVHF